MDPLASVDCGSFTEFLCFDHLDSIEEYYSGILQIMLHLNLSDGFSHDQTALWVFGRKTILIVSCQGLDQQAKVVLDRFLLRKITFSTSYTIIKKDWGKLSSTSWRGRDYINYLAFFCRLFILFLQLFQLCPLEALSCWSLCSFGMPSLLCFLCTFLTFLYYRMPILYIPCLSHWRISHFSKELQFLLVNQDVFQNM